MRRKKEDGDPYMQRFYVQDTLCVCYLIIYGVRRNSNYENSEEPLYIKRSPFNNYKTVM